MPHISVSRLILWLAERVGERAIELATDSKNLSSDTVTNLRGLYLEAHHDFLTAIDDDAMRIDTLTEYLRQTAPDRPDPERRMI